MIRYFADFQDGFPIAFYADDIWEGIPARAVEITEAQWHEFLNNQGLRKWDGSQVVVYVPPVIPPPLPTIVTAAQAKIALYNAGLLDAVKAEVEAHPYEPVRIWYANAGVWERGNAYVQALGVEMGLSDETIDALFLSASKII